LQEIAGDHSKSCNIMTPKKTENHPQMFQSRLDQQLNMRHELVVLSHHIDWSAFEKEFGSLYDPGFGRPGIPIRLLAGITYLSRMFDFSDEAAVVEFTENAYWQYFCGCEYFQTQAPFEPSSLVRWRKRLGEKGVEFLLKQTIVTAQNTGQLTEKHMAKVNGDTTVQEKNIAFPTDARLYRTGILLLGREARKQGIELRQSYVKVSKSELFKQSKYAHAGQYRRAAKAAKKLKTYLGRIVRDIRRKCGNPQGRLLELLEMAERLLQQKKHSKNKLYSFQAPEVQCIAKGKAHKKYEFGCKVGVVTTSRDNWIVGMQAFSGNPYDGHTLASALEQTERLTGWKAGEAYFDQGYRGHGYQGETVIHIVNNRRRRFSLSELKWRKRRAAIEPVIGHLKTENRMNRNYLKGEVGDKVNAMLAGCGWNLRKLLRILFWLFFKMPFGTLFSALFGQRTRCLVIQW
jgi:IS5 family transposase